MDQTMTRQPSQVHPYNRAERRIPMEIGVFLEGNRQAPGAESTFTENVRERGARLVSSRRWELNDRINFVSRSGDFLSSARVAYCQPLQGDGFASPLQILEPRRRSV